MSKMFSKLRKFKNFLRIIQEYFSIQNALIITPIQISSLNFDYSIDNVLFLDEIKSVKEGSIFLNKKVKSGEAYN